MLKINSTTLNPKLCLTSNGLVTAGQFLFDVAQTQRILEKTPQRILLNFTDSYRFAVAALACLSQHKTLVLLPNHQPGTIETFRDEFDHILSEHTLSHFGLSDRSTSTGNYASDPTATLSDHEIQIDADALMTFFTSGSHGTPKKVTKRFENLHHEVMTLEKTFGQTLADSSVMATISHQHVYGFLFKLLWPICTGRTFLAQTLEFPEQIFTQAKRCKSVTLVSSPAFLKRYFAPECRLTNCQAVFSSGGVLTHTEADQCLHEFGMLPVEVYGSTESGGIAHRRQGSENTLWTLFNDIELVPRPDDLLEISSPYFDQNTLIMGDRIKRTESGFFLLGRADDIVKIEEKRVSLSEINKYIRQCGLVDDSTVIDIESHGRQQTVCLAVLSPSGVQLRQTRGERELCMEIQKYLHNFLDKIVIPRKFRFVPQLPYNNQSKLVRNDVVRFFNEN